MRRRWREIFIGTGALLGIFAYICRQRPIIHCIHWWKWRSGAPAAWHHWCGRSQNSTGINWIPIECSSKRNIFLWHTWELLGRYLQKRKVSPKFFPLLANSYPSPVQCSSLPDSDHLWSLVCRRDEHWTGPGLWRILLNLDWIRTANCFINLGSGPDLGWINGKELRHFVIKKLYFVNILDFIWTWILNFLTFLDYGWTWTEF